MKNKAAIATLFIIALGLWAYIVFKIMSVEDPFSGKPKTRTKILNSDTINNVDSDEHLLLNYRDPFLGSTPSHKTPSTVIVKKSPTPQQKNNWPPIQYLGSIGNTKGGRIAILTIAQHEILLEQGKSYLDVTLVKVFSDSVKLTFKGEKKYIKIK